MSEFSFMIGKQDSFVKVVPTSDFMRTFNFCYFVANDYVLYICYKMHAVAHVVYIISDFEDDFLSSGLEFVVTSDEGLVLVETDDLGHALYVQCLYEYSSLNLFYYNVPVGYVKVYDNTREWFLKEYSKEKSPRPTV